MNFTIIQNDADSKQHLIDSIGIIAQTTVLVQFLQTEALVKETDNVSVYAYFPVQRNIGLNFSAINYTVGDDYFGRRICRSSRTRMR
jgi:hypothetical protein